MQAADSLEIGQVAPDFTLRGPGGQHVTLSDFRGRHPVVLLFYPLAFSPVCSHQLPAFELERARIEALGARVLGVSVDSWYANQAFAEKLGVGFPLLSDFAHEASRAYGVYMPERRHSGRALFVVDREGRLAYKDVAPKTSEVPAHEPLLAALARLSPQAG
jgi:peroxiredoxin